MTEREEEGEEEVAEVEEEDAGRMLMRGVAGRVWSPQLASNSKGSLTVKIINTQICVSPVVEAGLGRIECSA